MPANGNAFIARFQKLKRERAAHDERWEVMAPFIAPSRVGITTKLFTGDKITRGVYDSTTMMAAELMAMFIAGHIINPSQQWFDYRMRNALAADSDPIREWLQECRDLTLKRLSSSIFYAEGPESLIDYGGFGTGFMLAEEAPQPGNRHIAGFRGFYFSAEKTGRFLIQEGSDGLVDTAFREFDLTARVIADRWPNAELPENIKSALAKGEIDKPFKIIHGVYPRPRGEQTAGAAGMPWASCWAEHDSKTIFYESGYRTFPAAVPRYHRTPGDVYGRGRGDLAFPDAWTLNTAKRMGLEDWALKIRPPILHGHDSVIGTLRLTPGGPTSVNTHGKDIRQQIMPFETGSRPEVSQIKEEELRKSIKMIFYVDQILALLEVQKSEMTAFEFAKKIELLFRLLGPVYGRLEWEYLHRIIDLLWDIQYNARAFPPPPPEMQQTDGMIDIEFQNPIAKAQKSGDAEALTMVFNDLAPIAGVAPDLLQRMLEWVDPDETMDGLLQLRGVPAKWIRSKDELEKLRAEKQKQQEQDLQMQRLESAASAAGKAAPIVKALQGTQGAQQ